MNVDSYISNKDSTILLVKVGTEITALPDNIQNEYTKRGRRDTYKIQEGIDAINMNGYYIYKIEDQFTERVVKPEYVQEIATRNMKK